MLGKSGLALFMALAVCGVTFADDAVRQAGAEPASPPARLTDAELDKVFAGAPSLLILNNPGNANILHSGPNHFTCINACGAPTETGVTGLLIVAPADKVIVRCIGGRCP